MKLFDLHCDTVSKVYKSSDKRDLMNNDLAVSIPKLISANSLAQVFACFTDLEDYKNSGGYNAAYDAAMDMIFFIKQQTAHYDSLGKFKKGSDIARNENDKKVSVIIGVEDGGIINGDIERLYTLYHNRVRVITLLWNYENCMGYPNSSNAGIMWQGLKRFGREGVERMQDLGMVVDISHASDGVIRDVCEMATRPVIASHSNSREIANHPRNLSDIAIRAIANTGGVIGLNLYGQFLGLKNVSRVDEMIAHVLHIYNVGGRSALAIGTDFDGFDGMEYMEIEDITEMGRLYTELSRLGFTEGELEDMWSNNARRIFEHI